MATLSSSIVKNQVASMRDVEEALARQVLYGGDLATNLLELAAVSEAELTRLLAESHGLEPAPIGPLPEARDDTLHLVPGELALRHGFYPLREEGGTLTIAVSEPLPSEVEADLAFSLGVVLRQQAAPQVRIRQAISRDYAMPMDRRTLRLVAKLEGRPDPSPSSMPAASRASLSVPHLPRPASVPPIPYSAASPGPSTLASAPVPSNAGSDEPSAPPEVRVARSSQGAPPAAQVVRTWISPRPPPPEAPSAAAPRARGRKRHRGPYTAAMAEEDLMEAESRDDVLGAFFDFASQYFEYSALFAVHSDLAEGRDADGPGADTTKIRGIGVALDLPSSLAAVRDAKALSIAALSREGIDASLATDLERPVGCAVLLLPVVVRGRSVLILYGDHGDNDVTLSDIGDILAFSPLVASALERVILKRKLATHRELGSETPTASMPPVVRRKRHKLPPAEHRAEALARALSPVPPATVSAPVSPAPITDHETPAAKRTGSAPPSEPHTVAQTPRARLSESAMPKTPAESPAAKAKSISQPVIAAVGPQHATPPQGSPKVDPDAQPFPLTRRTPSQGPPPASDEEPPEDGWDVASAPRPFVRRKTSPGLGEEPPRPQTSPGLGEAGPKLELVEEETVDAAEDYRRHDSDTTATQQLAREVPLAPSSRKVAYGPRAPARRHSSPSLQLPSVIVDLDEDCRALVERLLDGDTTVTDQLVAMGDAAIPSLVGAFPGPIRPELARRLGEPTARASDCGPVLRVLARIGPTATPFLVVRTADGDPVVRRWATWLLGEMPSGDSARAVVRRAVDDDADVRRAAVAAGRMMQSDVDARTTLRDGLSTLAADPTQAEELRYAAIEALADLRDGRALPRLIPLLSDENEEIVKSVHWALRVLARTDFDTNAKAWSDWWRKNSTRHRMEWLIDGLMHDDVRIRRDAGEELKALSREYFGYYEDLSKKERSRVQERYREWWETKGKARYF